MHIMRKYRILDITQILSMGMSTTETVEWHAYVGARQRIGVSAVFNLPMIISKPLCPRISEKHKEPKVILPH
jgi:hypothetical protein